MISKKNTYRVLGLMSGTSLDGLDMAVCSFRYKSESWEFKIEKTETTEYPKTLLSSLKDAYLSSAREITELDRVLGKFIGKASKKFLNKENFDVDLIASHGHTVFHEPEKGYTLQIGSGAEIAITTGVKTICDFRSADVAAGGQGAPLVPIGDKMLFAEYDACLNLGGFANISFDNSEENRIAFDICPVNFVINRLANKLGVEYDDKGEIAERGEILSEILNELNNLNFYSQKPPKSLGQEWVEANVLPILSDSYKTEDLIRTFTEHVALQIAGILNNINGNRVLVTGGGTYNDYLIKLLSAKCSKQIVIPSGELIEFKEALVFAFLGLLRLYGEVNSLASVTGAITDTSNGAIYLP